MDIALGECRLQPMDQLVAPVIFPLQDNDFFHGRLLVTNSHLRFERLFKWLALRSIVAAPCLILIRAVLGLREKTPVGDLFAPPDEMLIGNQRVMGIVFAREVL